MPKVDITITVIRLALQMNMTNGFVYIVVAGFDGYFENVRECLREFWSGDQTPPVSTDIKINNGQGLGLRTDLLRPVAFSCSC